MHVIEVKATNRDPVTGRFIFGQLSGLKCPHCGNLFDDGVTRGDAPTLVHGDLGICDQRDCWGNSRLVQTPDGFGLVKDEEGWDGRSDRELAAQTGPA